MFIVMMRSRASPGCTRSYRSALCRLQAAVESFLRTRRPDTGRGRAARDSPQLGYGKREVVSSCDRPESRDQHLRVAVADEEQMAPVPCTMVHARPASRSSSVGPLVLPRVPPVEAGGDGGEAGGGGGLGGGCGGVGGVDDVGDEDECGDDADGESGGDDDAAVAVEEW